MRSILMSGEEKSLSILVERPLLLDDLILSLDLLRFWNRLEIRKLLEKLKLATFYWLLEVDLGLISILLAGGWLMRSEGSEPIFRLRSMGPLRFLSWSCFIIIIGLLFIFIQLQTLHHRQILHMGRIVGLLYVLYCWLLIFDKHKRHCPGFTSPWQMQQFEVDNIHTFDTYIFQLMAATLEQDLVNSQSRIITLLTEYEKASEQIIKSTYASSLHTLLDSIASFDHQKIKQCSNIIKDKTALEYLDSIADKIMNAEQNKANRVVVESPPIQKPRNRENQDKSKEKQKKGKKQGGLFDFVRKKFASKEKKATEMILPDEEPKCYYDPVTKTYVFQGDEPQAPKQIPKPPSTSERKAKQQTKRKLDDSQLGQLTAPPAFKRKSTAAGKGKVKIKQQVQVVRVINEPLSFARVLQEINLTYNQLIQKVKIGSYQSHSRIDYGESDNIQEFTKFVERSIKFSQEISIHENKSIEKWTKILTSESRELRIMERVLKQMSESANVYSILMTKLEHTNNQQRNIQHKENRTLIDDGVKVNQLTQTDKQPVEIRQVTIIKESHQNQGLRQKILDMENELKQIRYQNQYLKTQKQQLQAAKSQIEKDHQRIQLILQQQQNSNKQLADKCTNLNRSLEDYRQERRRQSQTIKQREQFYLSQAKRLNHEITKISYDSSDKIAQLQTIRSKLQSEKVKLKAQLKDQKSKHTASHDMITAQLQRQKLKIEQHLKFTQQRERSYLKVLKEMQQQENIIQEYDTIDQQNGLLRTIMKKRIEQHKNPEVQSNHQVKSQIDSSNSIISQLSDIIGAVTQTSLDRMEQFSRGYWKLLQRYIEIKALLNKVKNNTTNESICLNRTIAKIKGLFQICKIDKQEAEQKCAQLQLECDRLNKKLNHYKEQDSFNKSYITRLKPSKINNQDESILSLHEQKEELTTQIDDLHKQIQVKNETLKKSQIDLEDLLINYEKNQEKLLQMEARYKAAQRQRKQHRQIKEKLQNKIKLLELKLKNQRQRYDEIQNQQQSRLKTMQASYQKKLKLLKIQLDQSYQREVQVKIEHEQIIKEYRTRINLLQQSHHKIQNQLRDAIKLKSNENSQLQSIIEDLNQRLQLQREQKLGLNERNIHLMQTETQLNRKLNEIIDEHLKQISIHRDSQQSMNNIIATLLEKYNSFKLDQEQFKEHYQSKLCILQRQLELSQLQSNDLLNQINEYSAHIVNLNSVIQDINNSHTKQRQAQQVAISQLTVQNQRLQQEIDYQKGQCNKKITQCKQFQELIQKISQDAARLSSDRECLGRDKTDLQEKLIFKDRQLETLNNEINKINEQLMVKTQQLQQKDKIMLQHQQQAVMKQEELDELKNQLLKLQEQTEEHTKQLNAYKLQKEDTVMQFKRVTGEKDDEINHLKQRIDHLEAELSCKSYQTAINYQVQQILLLKERNQQLIQEANKQSAESDMQNTLIQSLQSERQIMRSQIQQLRSKSNELVPKQTQKQSTLQQPTQGQQQQTIQKGKQITDDNQMQQEIEYLLSQIEEKETQIDNLKRQLKETQIDRTEAVHQKSWLSHALASCKQAQQQKDRQIATLKTAIQNSEDANRTGNDQKMRLLEQNKRFAQANRFIQLDLLSATAKKHELQSVNRQLHHRIQELSRRLTVQHQTLVNRQTAVNSQIGGENMAIDSLIQDIRTKEQIIIQRERQIISEMRFIQQLQSEKQMRIDEMQNMYRILQKKDKLIEELKKIDQQNGIIIAQKESQIIELNKHLAETSQIIERQQAQLEKINKEDLNQIKMNEMKQLQIKLQLFESEKIELLKRIDEFNGKQIEQTKKIAKLQQKSGQVLISADYQELQEKYKTLLDENTSLMNEKVELMKSNNYLVSINQKLVGEKSSSNMREMHKAQSHIHPLANTKPNQPKQHPTSEIVESKQENRGFFGALSSLFLTPTQADRLRK